MIKLKITNLPEFQRNLQELGKRLENAARDVVEEAGAAILENAKARAPTKTGKLKESIVLETEEDGLSVTIKATAPYAKAVEFGTLRQPAQPFMFPALEEERANIGKTFLAKTKQAIGNE